MPETRTSTTRWLFSLVLIAGFAFGCGHVRAPGGASERHDHHDRQEGHADHAGRHGALRDQHPHAPRDIETYIEHLTSPERLAELAVDRVIVELRLSPDDVVADIGSGPGVFSIPLAAAVPDGLVYAVDVEPAQLDALRRRAAEAGAKNVVPVLASFDDPFLPPGRVDLAIVVDTYHHISDRVAYFRTVREALRPGGRLAIVEWNDADSDLGPPPDMRVSTATRAAELEEAGFGERKQFAFHRLHDFEIWQRTK